MPKIELIQGNCLEKMKDIQDGSVQLVFTSPPYNMRTRIRNGKYTTRERR
jgi:DNA modification methylase